MLKKFAKMLAAVVIAFFILMLFIGLAIIIAWTKGLALLLAAFALVSYMVYKI